MEDVLPAVHFRPITPVDLDETLAAQISEIRTESLARAYTYPALYFYGVYRQLDLDCEESVAPMVGFVALEVGASMGFVLRLMVGRDFRR